MQTTHLQQPVFENVVTAEEISHNSYCNVDNSTLDTSAAGICEQRCYMFHVNDPYSFSKICSILSYFHLRKSCMCGHFSGYDYIFTLRSLNLFHNKV